jgi:two-component system phosphate regulon sensor histidine kinase PhoR
VTLGVEVRLAAGFGLAAYGVWHLLQLMLFRRLLQGNRDAQGRWLWGYWRDTFARVQRLRRRAYKRKRRLRRVYSGFRKAAYAMPAAVLVLGQDGEIVWLNPQAAAYFGIEGSSCQGKRFVDVVDDPALRTFLQAHDFTRPLEIEAPGDPSVILSLSVTPFHDKGQRYLLVARDITRLYHLNQSQRDFALNVSHELRTPLTVLHGYLETLLDTEEKQSTRRRPILQMIEQTQRMQAVIQDLLTLTRLEDGSQAVKLEPVTVPDMLQSIVEEARELAKNSGHRLTLECDEGLVLMGDESLLRAAVSNLVFNAIRHTPGRTLVEICWGEQAGRAVLEVRDNGAGIPARHLPRLTERFYRVDPGRARDSGGSGLGLAIARQILELHDAQLRVKSQEGRGASFSCVFAPDRVFRVPGGQASEA